MLEFEKSVKDGVGKLRIYLDSAPVIYVVEEHTPYYEYVEASLSNPVDVLVASELTRLESRVKPIRESDHALIRQFDAFFGQTVDEIVSLTRDVLNRATLIRAQYGFRTPDAIHLGAALTSNCDVFLTNDERLSRFSDMVVKMVGDNLQE